MKYKDLQLKYKLFIGFGVLIAISITLGVLAIVNMGKTTIESKVLAEEYVPEVKIVTDLRGAANRAMYEMRGYGYTEEEEFYNATNKEVALINKALNEGKELDKRATRLTKLGAAIEIAASAEQKYTDLVDQTVDVNKTLANNRDIMDKAAANYMQNCAKYLESQNELMASEINSRNTTQSRLTKIILINDIIDLGNAVLVGNFKSQAKRDPKIFEDALATFPQVYNKLDEIRKYTKEQADILALDKVETAANNYKAAMESFITNWKKRETLAAKRNNAGKELITACADLSDAGLSG